MNFIERSMGEAPATLPAAKGRWTGSGVIDIAMQCSSRALSRINLDDKQRFRSS
jgi:hypothetical protein